eukprot:764321-Hanusia_phi.AAC.8
MMGPAIMMSVARMKRSEKGETRGEEKKMLREGGDWWRQTEFSEGHNLSSLTENAVGLNRNKRKEEDFRKMYPHMHTFPMHLQQGNVTRRGSSMSLTQSFKGNVDPSPDELGQALSRLVVNNNKNLRDAHIVDNWIDHASRMMQKIKLDP